MISLHPLKTEHIKMLSDPATEPGLMTLLPPHYWDNLDRLGIAYSGFWDGQFLGCGGYAMPWKGVAEVWLWALPEVQKHPLHVHKLIARALELIEREHGVKRISCEVRKGNDRAERWVKLLGFKKEGEMRRRGPDGSTFLLYARVRE